MVTPLWPFAQTLEISALITSMIAADPFVAICFLSQINTLRLDVDMKLQSGKVTSSCHHSTTSLMELQSGRIVGHKRVAPPGPVNRRGFYGRRRNARDARQAEEERRRADGSSDDDNSEVPSEVLDAPYGDDWRDRDDDTINTESDVPSEALAPLYDESWGDRGM